MTIIQVLREFCATNQFGSDREKKNLVTQIMRRLDPIIKKYKLEKLFPQLNEMD